MELGINILPQILGIFPDKTPRILTQDDILKIKTLFIVGDVPIDANNSFEVLEAFKMLETIGLLSIKAINNKIFVGNTYDGK